MPATVSATLHTDPGCPWAYSALPALRVLDWRYGDQIRLAGRGDRAHRARPSSTWPAGTRRGRALESQIVFRDRFGMPFSLIPKAARRGHRAGPAARSWRRACRPGSEWRVLRALQLANFTTPLLLDDDGPAGRRRCAACLGVDADALVARLDDPEVTEAYERDRTEARTAAGLGVAAAGQDGDTDGPVRYTAPSLVLEPAAGAWRPAAGSRSKRTTCWWRTSTPGWRREPPPDGPEPLLAALPRGPHDAGGRARCWCTTTTPSIARGPRSRSSGWWPRGGRRRPRWATTRLDDRRDARGGHGRGGRQRSRSSAVRVWVICTAARPRNLTCAASS